jgi:hypothetical protein
MTDSTEDQGTSLVQTDDMESAREAAWQAWLSEPVGPIPRFKTSFGKGWEAGAEWGIAATREHVAALVEAADELMNQFDAYQTRPSRDSAFGISFERWAALRTALQALESLGAPK